MISPERARELHRAGLLWVPQPGDTYLIDTVRAGAADTGTGDILTVDDTAMVPDVAVWLPREDQLRGLLGEAFRSLIRIDGVYRVETAVHGELIRADAVSPTDAYAAAVLELLRHGRS